MKWNGIHMEKEMNNFCFDIDLYICINHRIYEPNLYSDNFYAIIFFPCADIWRKSERDKQRRILKQYEYQRVSMRE